MRLVEAIQAYECTHCLTSVEMKLFIKKSFIHELPEKPSETLQAIKSKMMLIGYNILFHLIIAFGLVLFLCKFLGFSASIMRSKKKHQSVYTLVYLKLGVDTTNFLYFPFGIYLK